jgi:hypothetical protein
VANLIIFISKKMAKKIPKCFLNFFIFYSYFYIIYEKNKIPPPPPPPPPQKKKKVFFPLQAKKSPTQPPTRCPTDLVMSVPQAKQIDGNPTN